MPLPILDNAPTSSFDSLDDIRIATPCHASWDEMSGDARVRFCGSCSKNVYNLSNMTRAAALELVRETEGRICVRFHRRADGTMLTQDCPVGVAALVKKAERMTLSAFAACAAAVAAFVTLFAAADSGFVVQARRLGRSLLPANAAVDVTTPIPHDAPVLMGAMPPPPRVVDTPAAPRATMGEMEAPRELMGKIAAPVEAQRRNGR